MLEVSKTISGDDYGATCIEVQERRSEAESADVPDEGSFSLGVAWIDELISSFCFEDIFSAWKHSDDFKDTRAEYINLRLRFMLIFYATGVPCFLLLDYFFIQPEHFFHLSIVHVLFPAALILILLQTRFRTSLFQVNVALALTCFATMVFYGLSVVILNGYGDSAIMAGYMKMPHLMVVMMAVFPLTLLFSLTMVAMALVAFFVVHYTLGTLQSIDTFTDLWLLLLFGGLSLWIQSGQLLMLLKLYRESTSDALTGLINRRVLMKRLIAEEAKVMFGGETFSILMFDLDRFKRINDNYGHLTGDKVLRKASELLKTNLRGSGLLARYGGEEFIAVLPGARGKTAVDVAERLRRVLECAYVVAPAGEKINMPASIGVTDFQSGETIDEMISRADELLYVAKENGRNRVVFSYDGVTGSPSDSSNSAESVLKFDI